MKKTQLLTCFALISCIMSFAQSPLWVVGNQYLDELQPQSLPTHPNGYQGQPAEYSSNAYHNPVTGELLFFVIDYAVYNHEGYLIDFLSATNQIPVGPYGGPTQGGFCRGDEIAIFPDPTNCKRYFIVTSVKLPSLAVGSLESVASQGAIALLDLSMVNGNGRNGVFVNISNQFQMPLNLLTQMNSNFSAGAFGETRCKNILAQTKIAVSPLTHDNSRYLFISSSDKIFSYKIGAIGIQPIGGQALSFDINPDNLIGTLIEDELIRQRGEMELIRLSNGNYRIAVPYIHFGFFSTGIIEPDPSNPNNTPGEGDFTNVFNQQIALYLAELNPNGELIQGTEKRIIFPNDSPSQMITTGNKCPHIHGLEFSPDGNILYITHTRTMTFMNTIWYYDFSNPTIGFYGIQDFNINQNEAFEFAQSHIESAADGRLYLACNNRIARINNPNTPNQPGWVNSFMAMTVPFTHLGYFPSVAPSNANPQLVYAYKTYSLPDQIDYHNECQIGCYDFACGDGSSDESCCNFYSAFAPNSFHDIVISETANWQPGGTINGQAIPSGNNVTLKIGGNITIEPGATLNITDLRLEFSPTSKIIVSRGASTSTEGARLNVSNSTLTVWENCGDCYMWRGIEAQGDKTVSQASPTQAHVSIVNGARIEYAHFGILAGVISQSNWLVLSTINSHGGARITANNATFLNNKYDAFFTPYANFNNSSSFNFCSFITDDNLKTNIVLEPVHINMWSNRGIQIRASRFENETAIVEASLNRGKGIQASNSNFTVGTFPMQPQSQFNKLRYGIYTIASNSGINYGVYNTQFNSNSYGIFSQGELNSIIQNNTFNVFNSEVFETPLNETYGVQLRACNRYQVNNNLFKPNTPLTEDVHVFGCVVDNSGPFTNEISQNNFQGLHTGGVTRRQNATTFSGHKRRGLQWLCNSFANDYKNDVWVQSGANLNQIQGTVIQSLGGITQLQTAGNIFNTPQTTQFNWRMEDNVPPIWYLHYQQWAPMSVTNNVNIAHTWETRVCGRIIDLPPHQPEEDGRVTRLSLYDDKRSVDEQIDFGDTDSLILEVLGEYLTPEQKRDLLKQQSISISDEVLIKYMESNPSHQHLYQVLVYNSPITDKAMYHMMEHTDLPNGMKQQIILLQTGLSEFEAKSQISQEYELDIRYLENKLFEYTLTDSTNQNPFEQLIFMYEESPEMNLEVMENLFNLYLISENVTKADSINTILKGTVNDPNYAYINDLAVASLQTDYYTLLQDSNTVLMLEDIAELHDYRDAARAQALLSGYLGYEFEPITIMGAKNIAYPKYTYDGSVLETVSIFPNPAQDHFFIVFDENADVSQNREVKVYDLSGVLQFTREMKANDYVLEIKTENLAKGMYLVTISAEGKEISTQKVAVR